VTLRPTQLRAPPRHKLTSRVTFDKNEDAVKGKGIHLGGWPAFELARTTPKWVPRSALSCEGRAAMRMVTGVLRVESDSAKELVGPSRRFSTFSLLPLQRLPLRCVLTVNECNGDVSSPLLP
jgi:hypothetical protein